MEGHQLAVCLSFQALYDGLEFLQLSLEFLGCWLVGNYVMVSILQKTSSFASNFSNSSKHFSFVELKTMMR